MGRLVGLPYFLSEDAYDEEKTDARNIRKAKGGDFEDGAFETDPSKEVQMFISQRMQYQFDGSILRRTLNSLKWNGEPLIVLPPYDEIMLVVKLMDWEMEIITELADRIKERCASFCFFVCDRLTRLLQCFRLKQCPSNRFKELLHRTSPERLLCASGPQGRPP